MPSLSKVYLTVYRAIGRDRRSATRDRVKTRLTHILATALTALVSGLLPTATWAQVAAAKAQMPAAVPVVEDSVRKYNFLGKTSRDKDDHAAAVGYYAELLKYRPDYRPAHYYRGRAFLALGQPGEARAAFLAAAALDSTHTNTNLSLYQLYASADTPDTAWVYLRRALWTKPNRARYLEYRRDIADLHRRKGETEAAIGHYTALAENKILPAATRHELYELLAVLHDDNGNAAAALRWRQRLADLAGPKQIESLSKMVDLQIQTEDYDSAYATLTRLARLDTLGRYSHYHRMADLGDTAGDLQVRLEGLEGMARVQPRDAETLATIAEIRLNNDDLTAATTWLDRGLQQIPEDAHLRLLHGDLLARKGDEDGAIAAYELAMQDANWASVAQQRIWQIRPPETEEEKLKREFFGGDDSDGDGGS